MATIVDPCDSHHTGRCQLCTTAPTDRRMQCRAQCLTGKQCKRLVVDYRFIAFCAQHFKLSHFFRLLERNDMDTATQLLQSILQRWVSIQYQSLRDALHRNVVLLVRIAHVPNDFWMDPNNTWLELLHTYSQKVDGSFIIDTKANRKRLLHMKHNKESIIPIPVFVKYSDTRNVVYDIIPAEDLKDYDLSENIRKKAVCLACGGGECTKMDCAIHFVCDSKECQIKHARQCPTTKHHTCATCGNKNARLLCSRCKRLSYCSSECQKTDWKRHKYECNKYAAIIKK